MATVDHEEVGTTRGCSTYGVSVMAHAMQLLVEFATIAQVDDDGIAHATRRQRTQQDVLVIRERQFHVVERHGRFDDVVRVPRGVDRQGATLARETDERPTRARRQGTRDVRVDDVRAGRRRLNLVRDLDHAVAAVADQLSHVAQQGRVE